MSLCAVSFSDKFEPFVTSLGAAPSPTPGGFGERRVRITPHFADGPTDVLVRYALHGEAGAPTLIVQGGISAGRDVTAGGGSPGWWGDVVGPGRAIDTRRVRVLSIDWLDRASLGEGARAVSSRDQADALAALLDALGVARIEAFVGSSYGAMAGLEFAIRHGARLGRLVAISGAHRAHPLATALRSIQREIVREGVARGEADAALALARQLAMTTYRGAREFAERFDAAPEFREGRFWFPVEEYLVAAGRKFVSRFDAERYLSLSESIDLHRVDPSAVRTPTTLVAVGSDRLVPPDDIRSLTEAIDAPTRFVELDSPYGHDAFLKEPERIGAIVRGALARLYRKAEKTMSDLSPLTRAVRAGIESDTQFGAVVPALHLSTNYTFVGLAERRAYDYSRSGNPTRDLLGSALAELEGGAGAVVTASGMAAIALALELVPQGALVVAAHDCYGGTWRLLEAWAKKGRFRVRYANLTDPAALAPALAERPALVWVETPSNPLLRVTDVRMVAQASHAVGALVVVDNTFLSPALQRPISLGADIVVHSTTKYINGHSDVVGGAVVAKDPELSQQLSWWANCLGLTGAPFDAFLALRGLRTLGPRLRAHQENAAAVVSTLKAHPAVAKVYYPGLADHPQHALAARQQSGFGAMVSFELDADEAGIGAFVARLACFSLAESLGGVESLVAHPATMTHASMAPEARRLAGIADNLLRLSVGIEDAADLVADLRASLDRVPARPAPARAASPAAVSAPAST